MPLNLERSPIGFLTENVTDVMDVSSGALETGVSQFYYASSSYKRKIVRLLPLFNLNLCCTVKKKSGKKVK